MAFAQGVRTGIIPALKTAVVAGDAAGDIAVTGIKTHDVILSVTQFIGAGVDVTDVADLTDEFSITADDTVNNTGGTDTTGDKLLVLYAQRFSRSGA